MEGFIIALIVEVFNTLSFLFKTVCKMLNNSENEA